MTERAAHAHNPLHLCDVVKETPGPTCPAGLPVPRGTVLTRTTLRSVAVLVVLGLLVTCANLRWTAHVVRSSDQQRCSSVLADATIPLPQAASPSRDWEAAFEANARQRARQLGCKQGR